MGGRRELPPEHPARRQVEEGSAAASAAMPAVGLPLPRARRMWWWDERLKAAVEAYLDWREQLPAAILMDRILKAAGTRDLVVEVERLRQGLWDCAIRTGFDCDGNLTPAALVYPDIVELALREVEQLRSDYDEAISLAPPTAET